jgi:LysM repeat protein
LKSGYIHNQLMRGRILTFYFLLLPFLVIVPACAAPVTSASTQGVDGGDLIPFATSTHSPSQTPESLVSAETPLPSPTPFTYTVQAGDSISSIALKFGVSMDDLQAANPEISPNAMSIGQVIEIPSDPANPSGEPTPTPARFTVQQIGCYPTADKGMWCFVLIHNEFPDFMENISAQVTLVDSNKATIASQTALLPLNILPPNAALPLTLFFPPDIPLDAKPQVQVLTAIRLLPNDERYVPSTITNTLVQVNEDGHHANVSGLVLSQSQDRAASQVWVAATAYDDAGRVVGVRRWEWESGIAAGGSIPFEFMISSLGGKIARVEFAVEARR